MLRNDLGFEGVVICDDPSMRAISDHYSLKETFKLMFDAGIDLFCLETTHYMTLTIFQNRLTQFVV